MDDLEIIDMIEPGYGALTPDEVDEGSSLKSGGHSVVDQWILSAHQCMLKGHQWLLSGSSMHDQWSHSGCSKVLNGYSEQHQRSVRG